MAKTPAKRRRKKIFFVITTSFMTYVAYPVEVRSVSRLRNANHCRDGSPDDTPESDRLYAGFTVASVLAVTSLFLRKIVKICDLMRPVSLPVESKDSDCNRSMKRGWRMTVSADVKLPWPRDGRSDTADILQRHGIEPGRERRRTKPWKEFLSGHWNLIVAADFFHGCGDGSGDNRRTHLPHAARNLDLPRRSGH